MDEKAAQEMRTRDEGGAAQRAAAGRHLAAEEVRSQLGEEVGAGQASTGQEVEEGVGQTQVGAGQRVEDGEGAGHRQAGAGRGSEEEGVRTRLWEDEGAVQRQTAAGRGSEEEEGSGQASAGRGAEEDSAGQTGARRGSVEEEERAVEATDGRGYSHRRVLLTDVKEGAHRVLMARGGKGGAKGRKGAATVDGTTTVRPGIIPISMLVCTCYHATRLGHLPNTVFRANIGPCEKRGIYFIKLGWSKYMAV